MNILKLIVYPFGFAFVGLILMNLTAIAVFGPDAVVWLDWQNRLVGVVGAVGVMAGFVVGVYLAIKANARLIP
jgi:hypothetical protein